jgi:hypothetical protein
VTSTGGTVTVQRGAGGLEVVAVEPAEGWEATQRSDGPVRLTVTFERTGSSEELSIVLTPTGISSSTRSVTTG